MVYLQSSGIVFTTNGSKDCAVCGEFTSSNRIYFILVLSYLNSPFHDAKFENRKMKRGGKSLT